MTAAARFISRARHSTRIEWLALVAVVAVLTALVIPETRWASSGSLRLPVHVTVFDAAEGRLIPRADVSIFHASPAADRSEIPGPVSEDFVMSSTQNGRGITGDDGTAVIDYEFRTGASNASPAPKAHLRWEWVMVSADGYEAAVVPVRYNSVPTQTLRSEKQLSVLIGLMKADRKD